MGRPAVRVGDMHTCPLSDGPKPHVGGPVLPTGCPTVIIGGAPAARQTDQATCLGPVDIIKQGAAHVLIGGLPAARQFDTTTHGGVLVVGCPTVLIGKILSLRIAIVKDSFWDSAAGTAVIDKQLDEARRVLQLDITTGPYEVVDDPGLLAVPNGPWIAGSHYSAEQVKLINEFGAADRPVMVFTDSSGEGNDAITVSTAWAAPGDGLVNEGVIMGERSRTDSLVTAHELGHLLSREAGNHTHNETDPGDLMWPYTGERGDAWTDPWRTSAEQNEYLQ